MMMPPALFQSINPLLLWRWLFLFVTMNTGPVFAWPHGIRVTDALCPLFFPGAWWKTLYSFPRAKFLRESYWKENTMYGAALFLRDYSSSFGFPPYTAPLPVGLHAHGGVLRLLLGGGAWPYLAASFYAHTTGISFCFDRFFSSRVRSYYRILNP